VTQNIRDIFEQNIKLLGMMEKSVLYFREQQFDKALGLLADSIDRIKFVIEAIITDREYFNLVATESMLVMLTGILDAKRSRDFILLADLMELQLINFLIGVQELIISKEEISFNEESYKENINLLLEQGSGFPDQLKEPINTVNLLESGYHIEFTSCGQMTLAAENGGVKFYYHTNNKVQLEAFLLARHWYQKDKTKYIIYGLGMGYQVKELQLMAEEAEIEVYEADLNVIQLACAFADIKDLLMNKRIKLIYDPKCELFKEQLINLNEREACNIHYPSYKNIKSSEGKAILTEAFQWLKEVEAY